MNILAAILEDTSPTLKDFGYHQDNPGGDWLVRKQEIANDALEERPHSLGITGSITGSLGMHKPMLLPVKLLKKIPGARGENRIPGDHQYDHLIKKVKTNGFNNSDSPVLIMVNHLGQAYMWEGNTRTSVAEALAIPYIYAEVRYWNGGEAVDGPCKPQKLISVAVTPK